MFCSKCGAQVREGAAFCSSCGAPVKAAGGKVCPSCGKSAGEDMVFCDRCGSRLIRKPDGAPVIHSSDGDTAQDRSAAARKEAPAGVSRELLTMKMISWYKGETKVGIAKASGTLTVFTDRLELKKQMGNAAAALSPIAFVASAANAKKSGPEVFRMRDIVDAKEGKYGAVMPCLIVTMRGGEKHTFAGTLNGDKIRESVELIHRYCGR